MCRSRHPRRPARARARVRAVARGGSPPHSRQEGVGAGRHNRRAGSTLYDRRIRAADPTGDGTAPARGSVGGGGTRVLARSQIEAAMRLFSNDRMAWKVSLLTASIEYGDRNPFATITPEFGQARRLVRHRLLDLPDRPAPSRSGRDADRRPDPFRGRNGDRRADHRATDRAAWRRSVAAGRADDDRRFADPRALEEPLPPPRCHSGVPARAIRGVAAGGERDAHLERAARSSFRTRLRLRLRPALQQRRVGPTSHHASGICSMPSPPNTHGSPTRSRRC